MTWKFLRGVLMDEINGEGGDLGGGGAPDPAAGGDGAQPGGDPAAGGAQGEPAGATTEGMLAEITKGLAKGGIGADLPDPAAVKPAPGQPAPGDAAAAAGAQPKPGDKAQTDEAKAAADKLAADTLAKKKPDDFKLSDQEKAVLGPKAQARFQELTHYGKIHYERAERAQQEVTQLATARDNILKTFADSKAEPADLAALLDLNYRMKSGDLEGALSIIENTRAGILKTLGREAPGVDLLAEHADLKAAVDNQEMTRAAALEVAKARRTTAVNDQASSQQQAQQRQQQQMQEAQQAGLSQLQKWEAGKIANDIDYMARRAKIEPQVNDIIRQYPPNLWLPTIERLYDSVAVTRAPVVDINQNALRPNGAKPGPKAPNTMLDAIKTGLGYSAAG